MLDEQIRKQKAELQMQDPDDYKSHSSSDDDHEVDELRTNNSQSGLKDHASNVVASTPSQGGKKSALSQQKDSAAKNVEKEAPSKTKKEA